MSLSLTRKVAQVSELLGFFAIELWRSNIRMGRDILRPHPRMTPAIVAVPICLKHPWAISSLAHMITLTPGTLSLDLSLDRKTLYIHTMYFDGEDREAFVHSIKNGFERRLRRIEGTDS